MEVNDNENKTKENNRELPDPRRILNNNTRVHSVI